MKENPLEMLTQVRMLAGRVMAAFKVQYTFVSFGALLLLRVLLVYGLVLAVG